jgi:hypothetical protein
VALSKTPDGVSTPAAVLKSMSFNTVDPTPAVTVPGPM